VAPGARARSLSGTITDFLERSPLYAPRVIAEAPKQELPTMEDLPRPALRLWCWECEEDQTFTMPSSETWLGRFVPHSQQLHEGQRPPPLVTQRPLPVQFACAKCHSIQFFTVKFDIRPSSGAGVADADAPVTTNDDADGKSDARTPMTATITKVGQYPELDVRVDAVLAKALGRERTTFLRRGLVCEREGYGLAACAYYRRLVEETIGDLLDEILTLLPGTQREEYQRELEKAESGHAAAPRIELVKDILPEELRPGGFNPLGALYEELSVGVHKLSDAEALDSATLIREALEYLMDALHTRKERDAKYVERAGEILRRRSERKDKKGTSSESA
jgi:hypothetical protein